VRLPIVPGTLARVTQPNRLSRLDAAGGGLAVDIGFYALSAIFAGVTAVTATLPPHGAWGHVAVYGYAAAVVFAAGQLLVRRRIPGAAQPYTRMVLAVCAFVATVAVPLLIQASQRAGGRLDRSQEEVGVVESGGERLWHHGTPYLSHDAIRALPKAQWLDAYMPYQPGMALFGLPRAIGGVSWVTDARVWFLAVFVGTVAWALFLVRDASGGARLRAFQAAAVLPISALTLAVGGDDMPVLGLCLLALAFAARRRLGAAGVAVGLAAALKLFAWPVVLVLLALAATRGRREAGRYVAGAIGLPVLALIPAFAVDYHAAYENVVRFPILGSDLVTSPAASPLPGHLIATHLPDGHHIATALLGVAALAILLWLWRRPPRTASCAATACAWSLLIAILLISATRFGYLLYPVAYACWAPALAVPDRTAAAADERPEQVTAPS
jgi:hypothetical protein